jgi:response regulator RpfG family c-di-GMP phosphodiesterase
VDDRVNVLAVDDEEIIRELFAQFLRSMPRYRVFTAANGREAMERIGRGDIHCCFVDLVLPGMSGLELAEAIRAFDSTIPVVIMTGHPQMDLMIQAIQSGVVDFLTKPFRNNLIPITIEKALRERSRLLENILLKEEQQKYHQLIEINNKLQEKTSELETVNLILQQINEAENSQDLFNTLVTLALRITCGDRAALGVLTGTDAGITVIAAHGRNGTVSDPKKLSWMNEEATRQVARKGIACLRRGNNGNHAVVTVPLKIRSKVFGVLSARGTPDRPPFSEKDLYFLNLLAEKASSSIENMALYASITANLFATLSSLVGAIEARDPYTKQHSTRVKQISLTVAREIGFSQEDLNILEVAASLHDIGKIGIPDHILLKPGKLTAEEYEIVKRHPAIGGDIISHFNLWGQERELIVHHHERWDGKGYPHGLAGEEIPVLARLISVVDVFDALTSDRSYRKKLPDETALDIIVKNAGSQFDPDMVQAFQSTYESGKIKKDATMVEGTVSLLRYG